MSLEWHYKLPFDPPFLVPDCRSRKFMVPTDETLRIIDHDDPKKKPMSQTIDNAQLNWIRKILVKGRQGGSVAFIAPSTPLLLQRKLMTIMTKPEIAAKAWADEDLISLGAAVFRTNGVSIDRKIIFILLSVWKGSGRDCDLVKNITTLNDRY